MKVVQLIPTLNRAGAEKVVVTLANELFKNGQEVIVYTLYDEKDWLVKNFKDELLDNITIRSFGKKTGLDIFIFFRVFFRILKDKPDVIHSHLASINYLLLGFLYNFVLRVKYVHTVHNDADKEVRAGTEARVRKILFKRKLVKPITISEKSKASFFSFYHLESTLIPNSIRKPIPSVHFEKVKEEVTRLQKEGSSVLVNIGRVSNQKNQLQLVDAVQELNNNGANIQLLIIGGYRPGEEDLLNKIKTKTSDKIHLLGEKNNATDYLFLADAFILPSFYEGLPITLLEAMSLGCTPICSPVGGIQDVIKNGVNGYLLQSPDKEHIKKGITTFFDSNTSIKEECIAYYKENFDVSSYIKKHLKCYTDAV